VSSGNQNLAELHAYQGLLEASRDAASRAIEFAQKIGDDREECYSLSRLGWTAHLLGQFHTARDTFERAVAKQPDSRPFYSQRAVQYADHLRETGRGDEARAMTEANLAIATTQGWVRIISQCQRILGDLAAAAGQADNARLHYDESLKLARGSSHLPSLVEVLLARGRHAARRGDAATARVDLDEALSYAVSGDYGVDDATPRYAAAGGYRIYEADIRVALGWANLAEGDFVSAMSQAETARGLSINCGYLAGRLSAEEIGQAIEASRDAR
jgi:tetratricopeptide (TPR) repeat protein